MTNTKALVDELFKDALLVSGNNKQKRAYRRGLDTFIKDRKSVVNPYNRTKHPSLSEYFDLGFRFGTVHF